MHTSDNLLDNNDVTATTSEQNQSEKIGFYKEAEYIGKARAEAIARLGENYVMHPNYKPNDRHSTHIDLWWDNRTLKYPEVRYHQPTPNI